MSVFGWQITEFAIMELTNDWVTMASVAAYKKLGTPKDHFS
jgi:hypothetical protein